MYDLKYSKDPRRRAYRACNRTWRHFFLHFRRQDEKPYTIAPASLAARQIFLFVLIRSFTGSWETSNNRDPTAAAVDLNRGGRYFHSSARMQFRCDYCEISIVDALNAPLRTSQPRGFCRGRSRLITRNDRRVTWVHTFCHYIRIVTVTPRNLRPIRNPEGPHLKIDVAILVHVECAENMVAEFLRVAGREEHFVHVDKLRRR